MVLKRCLVVKVFCCLLGLLCLPAKAFAIGWLTTAFILASTFFAPTHSYDPHAHFKNELVPRTAYSSIETDFPREELIKLAQGSSKYDETGHEAGLQLREQLISLFETYGDVKSTAYLLKCPPTEYESIEACRGSILWALFNTRDESVLEVLKEHMPPKESWQFSNGKSVPEVFQHYYSGSLAYNFFYD